MTTTTAAICVIPHAKDPDRARPALDGLYTCKGHLIDLWQAIAELPGFHDDLTAPATPGPRAYGGGEESYGLVVDERTTELRNQIQHDLLWWAIHVADERGFIRPAADHPNITAPYLLQNLRWCAANRWVDELLDVMRDLRGQARGLTDLRPRPVPLEAPCRTHTDGEPCAGTVTIIVRGDDWTARCSVCDERQEATPYLRGLSRPDQWITYEGVMKLAQLYGIACSQEVVWQWRHRRRIVGRRGQDGDYVYALDSVQAYLAKRQAQARAQAERERVAS